MTADIALVLGASASGKSRLIRRVLEIAHAGGVLRDVRCAQRFTTRATRVAESLPGENEFLESEEFRRRVSCGEIDIDWSRQVTADRANWYGFSLGPQLDLPGLVLLSANNYLDWEANPLLSELRVEGRLVVVRVYAARETREARLRERRPPLADDEFDSRISDVPRELLPSADYLIPNDPQFEHSSAWEFLSLLTGVRYKRGA
jgi:hypothetical protein